MMTLTTCCLHQWGMLNANRCPAQPRGDLLAQRNPSCDIRTYAGGLATCLHGWHLLDADQELPWQDQPLVYYKKFRCATTFCKILVKTQQFT